MWVVEPTLRDALAVMPVTVLTGARQTGKSTLVRSAADTSGDTFLTLDDPTVQDRGMLGSASRVRAEDNAANNRLRGRVAT